MKRILSLALAVFAMTSASLAQGGGQMPSPPDSATGKVGGATVTVNYNSPSIKGRTIGKEIAPYGQVWRAGANKATIITTDKEITVGGKKLPAGKYSLYALPTEGEWTFMLNSASGQWGINHDGSTTMDSTKNMATVTSTPKKSSGMQERLVYQVTGNGLLLKWGNWEVPVPMK